MKGVIIAGGFGTRLHPLTYNIPKPIIPVMNTPFVFHQIELFKQYGINNIILNLHYLPDNMKKLLSGFTKIGINLDYSIEDNPLGTAGAVKNAEKFFKGEDLIVVFNGDILTDIDLDKVIEFHRNKNAAVTLTLVRVDDPTPFGLVICDKSGRVEKFVEKPSWEQVTTNTINAGIYVIDPKIFDRVPKDTRYSFERDLYPLLLDLGIPIYGYESDSYWLDIGNPVKYMKAHKDILRGTVHVNIPHASKQGNIWIGENPHIDAAAKISGPAAIGNNCKISKGAKIAEFSAVGDDVFIGENSEIIESVIWAKTKIGKNVILKQCLIGFNCVIEDDVSVGHGTILADHTWIKKGSRLG